MPLRGRYSSTAAAPERGGSSSSLSQAARAQGASRWSVARSAAAKLALSMPLRVALSRARATSASSPSTPVTAATWRAIGKVKLPSPQKRSSTRSAGPGCSRSSARAIISWFMPAFTWMKSRGRKASSTSACSMRKARFTSAGHSGCTLSGPPGCSRMARPCCWPKATSAARSASPSGCRWRKVSATVASPAAISICAISRLASREPTSTARSPMRSPTCGSSVWQAARSATKRGFSSRKPTSALPFFSTHLTDSRPLRR